MAAKIEAVIDTYLETHVDRYTSLIYFNFDEALSRGFGGLAFDTKEDGQLFMRHVCRVLCVNSVKEMAGVRCWGLFAFGSDDDGIEGIEGPSGLRFTVTGFRRQLYGTAPSPLDEQKKRLRLDISHHEERVAQARDRLSKIDGSYVDWEKQ